MAAAAAAASCAQGLDRYVKKKKLDPLDTYVPLVLEARDVLAELDGIMGENTSTWQQQVDGRISWPQQPSCWRWPQSTMLATVAALSACAHVSSTSPLRTRAGGAQPDHTICYQPDSDWCTAPCCVPAVQDPSTARQLLRSGPFSGMRDNIRALGEYAAVPAADGGAGLSESDAGQLVSSFFRALEDYDLLLFNAVREYKQQVQKAAKNSSSNQEDEDAESADPVDPAVGLDKAAAAEKLQLTVQKLDKLIATVPADVLARSQAVLAKVTGKKVAVPQAAGAS